MGVGDCGGGERERAGRVAGVGMRREWGRGRGCREVTQKEEYKMDAQI